MSRTFTSVVGIGLLSAAALAQPPSPYPMPGTIVGRPVLAPVGTAFPKVGTNPGTPIGYTGPDGRPINVGQRPAGQVIDLTNLAAPLSAPLPPDLAGTRPKGTIEKLYDKWREMLGFAPGPTQPTNTWVPGLSRRNRERKQAQWRRD